MLSLRFLFTGATIVGAFLFPVQSACAAEALEIGGHNFNELPRGKEADGIVGDFVLRNDKVEAVISGNLPLRRANMGAFYGDGNHTPGCLYDLTLKRENNDQITIFSPTGQKGAVNYVRIVDDGKKSGEAVIETMVSGAKGGGLSRRHVYRLKDEWQGVLITSTLKNTRKAEKLLKLVDVWTQMRSKGNVGGINWADSIDPADRCGYAYGWLEEAGGTIPKSADLKLQPGEEITVTRFLAVGRSPAEAAGIVGARAVETGSLRVMLKNKDTGEPVTTARLVVHLGGNKMIPAYPDDLGVIAVNLPPGKYDYTIEDIGRPWIRQEVSIEAGKESAASFGLEKAAAVAFQITDDKGVSIPCKAQFIAVGDTPAVVLGPTDRAHGCRDQYHSENGDFRVALPPGKYNIIVTRGPEYSHHAQEIDLKEAGEITVAAKLKRLVKTPGWVSADYHNHSTPSGDNTCGTDDRLINLAAEHIEFAPTTEHNRLYDWEPHISDLGLTPFLKTIPGMELTGRGAHFNTFPLKPDPTRQDGGAPVWQKDPRLNAIVLRDFQGAEPDRWVHVNHPDMVENFIDRNGDGKPDGGYAFFGGLIDALESQNYRASRILAKAPYDLVPMKGGIGRQVVPIREFVWLQLLNQGLPVWGVAVADAHHVHGNGVGGWRTYVPSTSDDPEKIDWRELSRHSKAGRMILSTGPFLEVETESGIIAGGLDRVSGKLNLKVKVQCTDWLDIDRVQVLVNGRQPEGYNFTREKNADMFGDGVVKFDHVIPIELSQDAHIIVVAAGENHTLKTGFGSSGQSALQPIAYNNPIYVDVDGGGFSPNYDTLGFDLPVKGLQPDDVKGKLGVE